MTFARISCALAVQMKGLGRLLHGNRQDCRDLQVLFSLGSEQNHAGPFGDPDLRLPAVGPRLQRSSLFAGEFDWRSDAHKSPAPQLEKRRRAQNDYHYRSTTLALDAVSDRTTE